MAETEIQEERMNEEQQKTVRKKEIKHTVNRLLGGVLLYELLMIVSCFIYMIIKAIQLIITSDNSMNTEAMTNQMIDQLSSSGIFYLTTILIGIPFLFWFFRKSDLKGRLLSSKGKMSFGSFCILLCIFMSGQSIFTMLGTGVEAGLNQLGYSILDEIESASGISTTISMFLYASILGPVSEEIIFRGFLLKGLQKYGSRYAIVISAIVFGAYHGNLIQGVFAAFVGLVLGYVAAEYSLKWSILLHIVNNLVFGDLLGHILLVFSKPVQTILLNSMEAAFLIGALIIIFLKRRNIINYIKSEKTEKGLYRYAFTSVWMIVFLALQLLLAILGIQKI